MVTKIQPDPVKAAAKLLADAYILFMDADSPIEHQKRWRELYIAEKDYRAITGAPVAEPVGDKRSAGGKARAAALTPTQRSEIGRKGAQKRWAMYNGVRDAR